MTVKYFLLLLNKSQSLSHWPPFHLKYISIEADKEIKEISKNTEVSKKLLFLNNLRKSIEMYKEDKSLKGK